MRRTIPSFRQLVEIEKLDWSTFKKLLPTKKDKQAFDMVFENARLYTSYLGNASNPIVLESVIMGAIFHNYKQFLQVSKEQDVRVNEDSLKKGLMHLINNKQVGKILFYRFSKKWYGFLHKISCIIRTNSFMIDIFLIYMSFSCFPMIDYLQNHCFSNHSLV